MRKKHTSDDPSGSKVRGPVVRNNPRLYKRLGEVSRLFGITASTVRNREADGTIPPIPRNAAGDRLIPIAWITQWVKAGGFPGPNRGDAPLSMPTTLGAPEPVAATTLLNPPGGGGEVETPGVPVLGLPTVQGAPAGLTDTEYRGDANRVTRIKDDAAAVRAELELKRAKRELDDFDRPAPVNPTGDGSALAALIQQNTELQRIIFQRSNTDPLEQAVKIITAMRAAAPDDRNRPETRLYDTLASKLVDRVSDRLFEPNGEGGAPSMVIELAKAVAPILGDLIRAGKVANPERALIDRGPVEPQRGAGNGSGVLPVPVRSLDDLAPDPVGAAFESAGMVQSLDVQQQGSGADMGIIGDVFEMIVNLYAGHVSPDDATQALYQVIGSDPNVLVRRLTKCPIMPLRILAIGSGVPQAAALMDTDDGREWVIKIQGLLADIYK
jgi:hypothetical protein